MIYDLTVEFCHRLLNEIKDRRTTEQMVQAARSGKQNIVEASLEKSLKMNIKLNGVSRASYGELLEDYKDFLRMRNLPLWDKNDPGVQEIRSWRIRTNGTNWRNWTNWSHWTNSAERFANLMISLISKENYLLDKMIHSLEEKFIREGGYSDPPTTLPFLASLRMGPRKVYPRGWLFRAVEPKAPGRKKTPNLVIRPIRPI